MPKGPVTVLPTQAEPMKGQGSRIQVKRRLWSAFAIPATGREINGVGPEVSGGLRTSKFANQSRADVPKGSRCMVVRGVLQVSRLACERVRSIPWPTSPWQSPPRSPTSATAIAPGGRRTRRAPGSPSSRLHSAHVQGAACSGTPNISSAERRERAIGRHSVLVDQTEHTIQLLGPVGRPGIGQAP